MKKGSIRWQLQHSVPVKMNENNITVTKRQVPQIRKFNASIPRYNY